MTRDDVLDVLKVLAAYDRRTVGQADVLAWTEQATRGRWSRDEVLEAVHEHHRVSDEFLKPVHIHRAVRAARRDQLEHAGVPSLDVDRALLRRIEAIADAKAIDSPRPAALPSTTSRPARNRSADTLAAAIAKGERARAQHDHDQAVAESEAS